MRAGTPHLKTDLYNSVTATFYEWYEDFPVQVGEFRRKSAQ